LINDSFIDDSNRTSAGFALVNFGVNDDLNTQVGFEDSILNVGWIKH